MTRGRKKSKRPKGPKAKATNMKKERGGENLGNYE